MELSGAIVLKQPRFMTCMKAMMWKLAVDLKGDLSNIEILEFEPFIKFKADAIPSQEDIQLIKAFTEIAAYTHSNMSRVMKLDQQMLSCFFRLSDISNDAENTLLNYISMASLDKEKKRLSTNYKKISLAKDIITVLRNIFDEVRLGLRDFSSLSYEDSIEYKEMEQVALEALNRNITAPAKLVYKFSGEDKIDDYDDSVDLIDENRKAEKLAKISFQTLDKKFSEKGLLSSRLNESRSSLSNLAYYDPNKSQLEKSQDNINNKSTFIEEQKYKYSQRKFAKDSKTNQTYVNKDSNLFNNKFSQILPVNEDLAKNKLKQSDIVNLRYEGEVGEKYLDSKEQDKKDNLLKKDESKGEANKENKQLNSNKEPKLRRMEMDMSEKAEKQKQDNKIQALEKQITILKQTNEEISKQLDVIEKRSSTKLLNKESNSKIFLNNSNPFKPALNYNKQKLPLNSWNLSLQSTVKSKYSESFSCLKTISDLNLAVTGDKLGQVSFWSLPNLNEIHSISVHESQVTSILYLNDKKTVFSSGSDGKLIRFDLNNFNYEVLINNQQMPLYNLCLNPLSSTLFVSSNEFIIELDLENKKRISKFRAHDGKITGLICDINREILISSSLDKLIKIWNLKTKENEGILEGHIGGIKSICYNKEKSQIVSIGKDSIITFWNLENSDLTKSLKMDSVMEKVIYLKDKKSYLTISKEGKFLLWNSETDKFKTFSDELDSYTSVSFGNDGKSILFATDEGSLELWTCA